MNLGSQLEKREIIIFSTLVISLSALICFISYRMEDKNISILAVFTPSIVAFFLTLFIRGKKGIYDLFIRQTIQAASLKWFLLSIIVFPALISLAILTSLNFDISGFELRATQLVPQIIVIVLIAVGEEYGWRGFLLPKLMKRFDLFKSSIILGLIWGIWHFPAYLIGTGVPLQMNFMVFLLWVVLGTLVISWIYYYTKSVLTSILAHIGANAAFNYLPILPEFTGSMHVFWIFICYLALLIFLVYFFKRDDLMIRNKQYVKKSY